MSEIFDDKFWGKVRKAGEDDCWEWEGSKNAHGYGTHYFRGTTWRAHRVAMVLSGANVEGGTVCHHCDNPGCVNPKHLYVGTNATNVRDMWSRGRAAGPTADNAAKVYCKRGHLLMGRNIRVYRGMRTCRPCRLMDEIHQNALVWQAEVLAGTSAAALTTALNTTPAESRHER